MFGEVEYFVPLTRCGICIPSLRLDHATDALERSRDEDSLNTFGFSLSPTAVWPREFVLLCKLVSRTGIDWFELSEAKAFEAELISLIPHLRAFGRHLSGDVQRGEDLAQETARESRETPSIRPRNI